MKSIKDRTDSRPYPGLVRVSAEKLQARRASKSNPVTHSHSCHLLTTFLPKIISIRFYGSALLLIPRPKTPTAVWCATTPRPPRPKPRHSLPT